MAPNTHSHEHEELDEVRSWAGDFDPLGDASERKVLFSAFDSFRWVITVHGAEGI